MGYGLPTLGLEQPVQFLHGYRSPKILGQIKPEEAVCPTEVQYEVQVSIKISRWQHSVKKFKETVEVHLSGVFQ